MIAAVCAIHEWAVIDLGNYSWLRLLHCTFVNKKGVEEKDIERGGLQRSERDRKTESDQKIHLVECACVLVMKNDGVERLGFWLVRELV